jgi:predicted DNA-binding ribbon-helix-helix protein
MSDRPELDPLEPDFWAELRTIAKEQRKTIGKLLDEIEAARPEGVRPQSEVRRYVLSYIKARTQAVIGHGRPL